MKTWTMVGLLFLTLGLTGCASEIVMQNTEPMPNAPPDGTWRHLVKVRVMDLTSDHFVLGDQPLNLRNKRVAIRETVQNQLMRYGVNYTDQSPEQMEIEIRQFDLALFEQTYSCTIRLDIRVKRQGWVAYEQEVVGQSNSLNVVNSGAESAIYAALEQAMGNVNFDQVAAAFDLSPSAPYYGGGGVAYMEPRPGVIVYDQQGVVINNGSQYVNNNPSVVIVQQPQQPPQVQPIHPQPHPQPQPQAAKISKSIAAENIELGFLGLRALNPALPSDPAKREHVKQVNKAIMAENMHTMQGRAIHGDKIAIQWLRNHGYVAPQPTMQKPKSNPNLNSENSPRHEHGEWH